MGGRRRNTGNVRAQDPERTRSLNRKPPAGCWQPSVPPWEKKFCSSVGSVPWKKLLEAKRFMHLYNNVVKWNDSAGEEAFSNAKERFYAEINGLPCDISLPDPDKYIDEIDWNSAIDPELLSDLEHERSGDVDGEDGSGGVIFGSVLLNQSFGCTGWGDAEEVFEKISKNVCPVPEFGSSDMNPDGTKNSWDHCHKQSDFSNEGRGWSNHWNNNNRDDCNWNDNQYWHRNHWNKTKVSGGYLSRYEASRFHGSDSQMHHGWRNEQGMRRDNSPYQQSSWI